MWWWGTVTWAGNGHTWSSCHSSLDRTDERRQYQTTTWKYFNNKKLIEPGPWWVVVIHTLVKISFSFWWLNWYNINISVNCCDSEVPIPVWIVHVFLSYFVRLGVHVDWVLRLGAHVVLPDNAALLRHLGLIGINSLNLLFCEKNLNKTSDAGSFFKCHTDSTKRRFSVAYSFSRNDKKWSRPSGSFSSSQPEKKIVKI